MFLKSGGPGELAQLLSKFNVRLQSPPPPPYAASSLKNIKFHCVRGGTIHPDLLIEDLLREKTFSEGDFCEAVCQGGKEWQKPKNNPNLKKHNQPHLQFGLTSIIIALKTKRRELSIVGNTRNTILEPKQRIKGPVSQSEHGITFLIMQTSASIIEY